MLAAVLVACASPAPELHAPDTGAVVVLVPDSGRCSGLSSSAAGPCTCNSDCQSALCATELQSGLPGGSCLQLCDPMQPAPPGYHCPLDALFQSCDAGQRCREGYYCFLDKATRLTSCLPQCSRDSQCATGHCDLYSGLCRPERDGGSGLMGPCTRHDDCKSSSCAAPGVSTPPWCATLCNTLDRVCPEGGVCIPTQFNEPDSTEGLCLRRCVDGGAAACPPGFTCNAFMNCIPGP